MAGIGHWALGIGPSLDACVFGARGWEARFDRVYIDACTINRGRGEVTKFRYRDWPGRYDLQSEAGDGWSRVSIVGGSVLTLSGRGQRSTGIATVYGTELVDVAETLRADARILLFTLGVLVYGDVTLSQALTRGKDRSLNAVGKELVDIRFTLNEGSTVNGRIHILFNWVRGFPVQITMLGPSEPILRRSFSPASCDPSTWTPMVVKTQVWETGKGWTQGTSVRFNRVLPLTSPPVALSLPAGATIDDQATGLKRLIGAPKPLTERDAAITLRYASRAQGRERKGDPSGPTCGPESLYYLSRLSGVTTTPSAVLGAFRKVEDGVSMLDIKSVGAQLGMRLEATKSPNLNLQSIRFPSILSTRESHFVVVVRKRSSDWVVIDPPYGVKVYTDAALRTRWTGYALSPEGASQ